MSQTAQAPASAPTAPAPAPAPVAPANPQPQAPTVTADRTPVMRPEDRQAANRADELIRQQREAFEAAQRAAQEPQQPTPPPEPNPPPAPEPQQPQSPQEPKAGGDELARLRADLARAENNARTWEGRYRTTQEQTQAQVDELRQKLEEATRTAARTRADELMANISPLSQEEIENFGPEMMDAVGRHARALVAPMVQAAVERLETDFQHRLQTLNQRTEQFGKTQEQISNDRFLSNLDSLYPDWRRLDTDAGFLGWLNAEDASFGARKIPFDKAVAERNAARVVAFMKGFAADQGGSPQPPVPAVPAPNPGPASAAPDDSDQPGLADFAAPGRASASGTQPTAGPRIWTRAEITAHYAKAARGGFKTPADKQAQAAIEQEIALAQRESRVRL